MTTRRLMVLVALSAGLMCGLRDGAEPGWHVPLPGGLRAGLCRADLEGLTLRDGGVPRGRTYRLGAWPAGSNGPMAVGLRLRDGLLSLRLGDRGWMLW